MLMQNNGWPLGLGNMNVRFAVAETSVNAAAEAMPYASHRIRSSSSSSISSSNLDTESAASFFPDQSVSLGRLIGIGPGNTGSMHCPNTDTGRQHENLRSHSEVSKCPDDSQGLCVPLLHNVIGKMSKSRSCSRRPILDCFQLTRNYGKCNS